LYLAQITDIESTQYSRFDSILDAELAWREFCEDNIGSESSSTDKRRYIRLNPNLGDKPPELDDKAKLPKLQRDTKDALSLKDSKLHLHWVAERLVASLFYYERSSIPRSEGSGGHSCSGLYMLMI